MINGGYLVVDELENHFNAQISTSLIRLFYDPKINVNGGTLIFSTHYPLLLDQIDRLDCIYLLQNKDLISASRLDQILSRKDIKKSDIFISGYLDGTAPDYLPYRNLVRALIFHNSDRKIQPDKIEAKMVDQFIEDICEGNAELAIIRILLESGLLKFTEEDLINPNDMQLRNGKKFSDRYLGLRYPQKVKIFYVHDSHYEKFILSKTTKQKAEVFHVITAPEIEILHIIDQDRHKIFLQKFKSKMKPSEYCKQELRIKYQKGYEYNYDYWYSRPEDLVRAIKEYERMTKKQKDEFTLADLLKS